MNETEGVLGKFLVRESLFLGVGVTNSTYKWPFLASVEQINLYFIIISKTIQNRTLR